MTKLTPAQLNTIRSEAIRVIVEDAQQDNGYLWSLIERYVELTPDDEVASLISDDPDILSIYFDFDPSTGKPWEEFDI